MAMTLPKLRKRVLDKKNQKFTDVEAHELALLIFRINTQNNFFNLVKKHTKDILIFIIMSISIFSLAIDVCLNASELKDQSLGKFLLMLAGNYLVFSYAWYYFFIKAVYRDKSLSEVYETYIDAIKLLKFETKLLGTSFSILDALKFKKIGSFYEKKLGSNFFHLLVSNNLLTADLATKLVKLSPDSNPNYLFLLNLFDAADVDSIYKYVPEKDLEKIYGEV